METQNQPQNNDSITNSPQMKKKRGPPRRDLWRYSVDEAGNEKYDTHRYDEAKNREYRLKYYLEKQKGEFPCKFCGQVVASKSNLNRHQRKAPICLLKQQICALQAQLSGGMVETESESNSTDSA